MKFQVTSENANDSIVAFLDVGKNHPHFKGHFQNFPVLPAVSQIEMVVELLELVWQKNVSILSLSKGKFHNLLRPDTKCKLTVKIRTESKGSWVLESEDKVYSKGSFCYGETAFDAGGLTI